MQESDVLLESPAVGLLGLHIFELPAIGLPEFNTQLSGETNVVVRRKKERKRDKTKMPELRPKDVSESIPIPMKPLVPAIPTEDEELRELGVATLASSPY